MYHRELPVHFAVTTMCFHLAFSFLLAALNKALTVKSKIL